jgi:hypothetical protein
MRLVGITYQDPHVLVALDERADDLRSGASSSTGDQDHLELLRFQLDYESEL